MQVIINSNNEIVSLNVYSEITPNVQEFLDSKGYKIIDVENPIESTETDEIGIKKEIYRTLTTEDLTGASEAEFRAKRNELLKEADILINKAEDNGEDSSELRAYRQALRDATIDWVIPSL